MNENYTKDKIIYYSLSKFINDGLDITMESIAKDLGISKKTLYKHFKNKSELLDTIVTVFLSNISNMIDVCFRKHDDSLIAMCDFLSRFANNYASKLSRRFFIELKNREPQIWKKIDEFRIKRFKYFFPKVINEGINKEYFRKDINPEIILMMYISSIQGIINPDVLSESSFSVNEAVTQILNTLFLGICTEKGKRKFLKYFNKYKGEKYED